MHCFFLFFFLIFFKFSQYLIILVHFTISWQSCKMTLDFTSKNIFLITIWLLERTIYTQIGHCYFPTAYSIFFPIHICLCSSLSHTQMHFQENDVRAECVTQMRCWGSAQWGPCQAETTCRGTVREAHTDLLKRWVLAVIYSLHPRQSLLTSWKERTQ